MCRARHCDSEASSTFKGGAVRQAGGGSAASASAQGRTPQPSKTFRQLSPQLFLLRRCTRRQPRAPLAQHHHHAPRPSTRQRTPKRLRTRSTSGSAAVRPSLHSPRPGFPANPTSGAPREAAPPQRPPPGSCPRCTNLPAHPRTSKRPVSLKPLVAPPIQPPPNLHAPLSRPPHSGSRSPTWLAEAAMMPASEGLAARKCLSRSGSRRRLCGRPRRHSQVRFQTRARRRCSASRAVHPVRGTSPRGLPTVARPGLAPPPPAPHSP
jgi:hypothetical protein